MKVFAIVGSWAGEGSHTAKLCKTLFDKLNGLYFDNTAEFELITMDQVKIDFCRSCDICVIQGYCPLAATDDIGCLTQKMLDADLLLFGSPVYVANVSGSCKNFLDRLEMWYHTLGLAGKICVPVVTSSNGYAESVVGVLEKCLLHMGAIVPGYVYGYRHIGKPLLYKAEEMESMLTECCEKIGKALENSEQFVTQEMELYFSFIKKRYARKIRLHDELFYPLSGETEVWYNHGYYKYGTFAELLKNLPKKRTTDYLVKSN